MAEMQFDFDGLIQLLAGHLYSEKKVFIRELIQNSHDAIQRRAASDKNFSLEMGRIDIYTDLNSNPPIIRFCDNGLGMSKRDLDDYLSSVGSSGTRTNVEDAPDVIGQFGIGFLSGFVVAKKIIVRTKSVREKTQNGWRWENEGKREYTLSPENKENVGTEVIISLASAEDNGLLQDQAIRDVVHTYADMLKIPIYLNYGETPINTRIMPWERSEISAEERDIDSRIYLERNMPDSVLEVIPLNEAGDIKVSGVLYITQTRAIGRDAPRVIRIFQKRMFLCKGTPEILPKWAGFINGVLNTDCLSPNAARDNFRKDANYDKLRHYLGELIITHFEKLKQDNPQRLSEILAYHDFQIKAACHYYDIFFEKFGHLLEWRVNSQSPAIQKNSRHGSKRFGEEENADYGWVTLPELVAALPKVEGDSLQRLSCFTSQSSANQFFEMANAAKTSVLDASSGFETELIKTWANQHPEIRLVYVDREDDPNVFTEIDLISDKKIQDLADQMSLFIRIGQNRLRVEARRFEPQSLPAVLKSSSESSGARKANEILNDPNASASLRAMAEEMKRLAHATDMRMTINANNPLIRKMAALDNFEDPEVIELMLGIYNDAILYNQELMTPHNAKVFHQQYGRLLLRSVDYLNQSAELAHYKKQNRQQQQQSNRTHKVAFYITPFHADFATVHQAVRAVIEEKLGCQLMMASDLTYEDMIRGNVRQHIDKADFYIADVTGANANVMQELGAVHYGRTGYPTLLIAGLNKDEKNPKLPADLEGHIASTYRRDDNLEALTAHLYQEFQKHHELKQLLADPQRQQFLSADCLAALALKGLTNNESYHKLSEQYPTANLWFNLSKSDIEPHLIGNDLDLADVVLTRIKNNLNV